MNINIPKLAVVAYCMAIGWGRAQATRVADEVIVEGQDVPEDFEALLDQIEAALQRLVMG